MTTLARLVVLAGAVAALGGAVGPAGAQDKTLSEGHPLTRLGDAFPVSQGDAAFLAGTAVVLPRRGGDRGAFPLALQYNPLTGMQVGLGTELSSRPDLVDDPHAGDLTGSLHVNTPWETTWLPWLAATVAVTVPSGVDSEATRYTLKGYATKTIGPSLFLHLNAGVDFSDNLEPRERQGRYRLAIGANYPVPQLATLVLAGDVFSDQARIAGEPNTTGVEAGVRVRVTSALYWDAGAGTELAGPRDRARFFFTTGFTFGFTLGNGP